MSKNTIIPLVAVDTNKCRCCRKEIKAGDKYWQVINKKLLDKIKEELKTTSEAPEAR